MSAQILGINNTYYFNDLMELMLTHKKQMLIDATDTLYHIDDLKEILKVKDTANVDINHN